MFGFGRAISNAKAELKVSRRIWGKNEFIVYMAPLRLPPYDTQKDGAKVNDRTAKFIGNSTALNSLAYFAKYNADGSWQPGWIPSQADMLSEDWYVIHKTDDM